MSQRIEIDTDRENAPKVLEQFKDHFHSGKRVILYSRQKEESDLIPVIGLKDLIVRSYSTARETLGNIPRGQSNTLFIVENTTGTDFNTFVNNAMNPTNSVILLNVKENTETEKKTRKVFNIQIKESCTDAPVTVKNIIDAFYGTGSQFSLNGVSIKIGDSE